MEQETVCDLRRTNIFLRLVLFLFTLIIVGAAVALFFVVFLSRPSEQTTGIFLLIFAAVSYAAAEFAVSQARLYRYGIEEALAVCSVGFLCAGMRARFVQRRPYSPKPDGIEFLVPAAGAIVSLWIWRRFGLSYAFLAAMIFVVWLPGYWTSSHSAQHVIVAAFYAAGLIAVAAVRSRHRFDVSRRGLFDRRSAPLARHLPGDQPPAFVVEPARAVVGRHSDHLRILKAVLLGHLGADLVPAARRTRARPAPEGPLRHRSGRDRRHPDPGHQ